MSSFYGQSGTVYRTSGTPAGRGGRGRFFRCVDNPAVGVKVLDDPAERAECRDRADLLSRWSGITRTMLPIEAVSEVPGGPLVGYALPVAEGDPLGVVLNPPARAKAGRRMDERDLIGVAASAAEGMAEGHAAGLPEGDVNPGNRIVSRVRMNGRYEARRIDADSSPVRGTTRGGRLADLKCPVGQPEFTPPEASGKNLRTVDRGWQSDVFGLAVLIWMLVKEGSHPFAWRHRHGGSIPSIAETIQDGGWPFSPQKPLPPGVEPVDVGVRFRDLPPQIQALFTRAFRDGHADPSKRPTAREWADALTTWERQTSRAAADARAYLSALWGMVGGRAGLAAVSRVAALFRRPAKSPLSPAPARPAKGRLRVRVPAALLMIAAAALMTICGVKYLPPFLADRGAETPRQSAEPAGPAGGLQLQPDDLFDGVPLWDELHREVNAERRKTP